MEKLSWNIDYCLMDKQELDDKEQLLIDTALEATKKSYNPYSHFSVGAAVLLDDGSIVVGTNQENVAYPSGLCAERTALFASRLKEGKICCIAIAARNENNEISTAYPCGACRQVMMEFEKNISKQKIKVLILKDDNKILCFNSIDSLLPFSFDF